MTEVKTFWDDRAADPSCNPAQVTHPDIWQRWLEIETVKRILPRGKRVIDIGCGNGFATKQIAPLCDEILGVDYSDGMITRARAEGNSIPRSGKFAVADVLDLNPNAFGLFDVAITMRCLINLVDWNAQKQALINIAQILRPNGLYIFIEGSRDGREALNRLREAVGLQAMPTVWHNVDFDHKETLGFLDDYFILERHIGFGSYDLIARAFHPLYVAPGQPEYNSKINELAARLALERPDDIANSRVAVYCLRRRE